MRKAIFLDLDHTLITTKSGATFPKHPDDWKFNLKLVETLKLAHKRDYMFAIVSNQGGIEKGYTTKEEFERKIQTIIEALAELIECPISNIVYMYSQTNDPKDFYRKPNPGMAYHLALENKILLNESVMIGDASGRPGQFSSSDFNFAKKAGFARYYDVSEVDGTDDILIFALYKDRLIDKEAKENKEFFDDINGKL